HKGWKQQRERTDCNFDEHRPAIVYGLQSAPACRKPKALGSINSPEVLMNSIAAAVVALLIFASTASAQWTKDPASPIPQTREGKPNLSARAPKTQGGKIDLSGVWLPDVGPKGTLLSVENQGFSQYFINIAADLKQD